MAVRKFKCLFHVFNAMFLLSGLAVFAVGIWSVFWRYHFVLIVSTYTYAIVVNTLFVIGILVTLVNLIGYVGVWKENRCTILYYINFLFLIMLMEVFVALQSYAYLQQMPAELSKNLNETFVQRYNVHADETQAIDYIQRRLRCCGAVRFEDWRTSQWYFVNKNKTTEVPNLCRIKNNEAALVPMSCCKAPSLHCGCSDHPNNIFYNGCIHKVEGEIRNHLSIIMWVAMLTAGFQIFGIIFSCILCSQVNKNPY